MGFQGYYETSRDSTTDLSEFSQGYFHDRINGTESNLRIELQEYRLAKTLKTNFPFFQMRVTYQDTFFILSVFLSLVSSS